MNRVAYHCMECGTALDDNDRPVIPDEPKEWPSTAVVLTKVRGMTRPFMVYVVTDRYDPYINGGRPVRVCEDEAAAWSFVAEQTALRATERWYDEPRYGMTRDDMMEAESHAFQVWSGAMWYPPTESDDMLEIRP